MNVMLLLRLLSSMTMNLKLNHQSWKKWKLLYQLVIQVLILGFNIATLLYIKRHKIPISTRLAESSILFVRYYYCFFSLFSTATWTAAAIFSRTHQDDLFHYSIVMGNIIGCFSHLYGFAILAYLLDSVSPAYALYLGLLFVLCSIASFIHSLYVCHLVEEMSEKQSQAHLL